MLGFLNAELVKLNDISDYEYFMLKTAVITAYNKDFDCGTCVKKYTQAKRDRDYGCSGFSKGRERSFDDFTIYKCVGNFKNIGFSRLVGIYSGYEKSGSSEATLEQSAKFTDAMNLIGSFVAIEEKRIHEEHKKSLGNKNGRK